MTTAHSPLPWNRIEGSIADARRDILFDITRNYEGWEEDAALIVRAVNAFEPMCEALTQTLDYLFEHGECGCYKPYHYSTPKHLLCYFCMLKNKIEAALALASSTQEEKK